jgi:dGTPase
MNKSLTIETTNSINLIEIKLSTICNAFNLTYHEDLIEAIALGHDIGHVPFGHTGEAILNEICLKENLGYFNHNIQSVRTLMDLENNGEGINLCIQTLDGIMCHNGEFVNQEYYPKKKTKEEFLKEYENSYIDKDGIKTMRPMTLEGCVVRISDIVGYIGRDIEDAVRLGVLDKKDLPFNVVKVLGSDNKTIVNTIVLDIIENSLGHDYLKMSDNVYHAIKELKAFNYENIYLKANSKEQIEEYKKMFQSLFYKYVDEIEKKDTNAKIYQVFLKDMNHEYKEKTSSKRIAVDYIAGMTDDYFVEEYKKLG